MDNTIKSIGFTGQRLGSSEPVGSGSVREGSCRSSISDFSESCVGNQAQTQDTITGIAYSFPRENVHDNHPDHKGQENEGQPTRKEFNELQKKLQEAYKSIADLKEEIRRKTEEHSNRDSGASSEVKKTDEGPYFTDSSEFDMDKRTDNKRVKVCKKRKTSSPQATEIRDDLTHLHIPSTEKEIEKKSFPPFTLMNITDPAVVMDIVKTMSKQHTPVIQKGKEGRFKINVYTDEDFRRMPNILETRGIEWFNYENKNDQPIKVVMRGLH